MLEAQKKSLLLLGADGAELGSIRAYVSYTTYSSRDSMYGRENSYYYTALTYDRTVREGMFLFDGERRYRIISANSGGAETILRLVRRVTFPNPASSAGTFDFLYRAVRERVGLDVLAGGEGVTLTLSVTSREEGIVSVTGELIARSETLGEAEVRALTVVGALSALCEASDSPLLSLKRGAYRFEREETGGGFVTKETLHLCLREDFDHGTA